MQSVPIKQLMPYIILILKYYRQGPVRPMTSMRSGQEDITRYEMRMLFCRVSTMANSTQKKSKMQLLPKHIFTEPIGIID